MRSLFGICAIAGVAAWPGAVSLAPRATTRISLLSKKAKAEMPCSKAEAPPVGTDAGKSTLDHEPRHGRGTVIF